MRGEVLLVAAVCGLVALPAWSAAGCGDDGAGGAGARTTAPGGGVVASPSPNDTAWGGSDGVAVGAMSSSTEYDAELGGVFQAVGFEVGEAAPGGVRIAWVASPEAAGSSPEVRCGPKPGVLDIWLSDTRFHADLVTVVKPGAGPVKSARFVAPPDDSLIVLRVTLRESGESPVAIVSTRETGDDRGEIEVRLGD